MRMRAPEGKHHGGHLAGHQFGGLGRGEVGRDQHPG
ncbi:MAG: hypothetical protein K0R33_4717, partial [Mycobacterium sp.]|nr:hypothetical protein [Mycobacterium sp.]